MNGNPELVKAYGRGKKFLLWLAISFLGFFMPSFMEALLNVSQTLDFSVLSAAVVSAVMAAVTACLRLMIAQFPLLRVDNNIGKTQDESVGGNAVSPVTPGTHTLSALTALVLILSTLLL